jgi:hypothetical protein
MDDAYPVGRPEHVAAWLAIERTHVEQAATPSLPRYQAMFDERFASLTEAWTAAQGTGRPLDGMDLAGMREGMRTTLSEECWDIETSRTRVEQLADGALAALRTQVPDDPEGGHRPVTLGSTWDDPEPYLAVACLDCDWIWVLARNGAGTIDAVRRHRAAHLEPPAWGLCENCQVPQAVYLGDNNTRNVYRRAALDPETATDVWPRPAIGVVHLWWGRQGPYPTKVCPACFASLDAWMATYEDQQLNSRGELYPPGHELVGNPVRPFQGPGAELDEQLREQR